MKLWKLLTVPVVLLLSMAFAVTASAHTATISGLTAGCGSTNVICVDFKATTTGFSDDGRDIQLVLLGHATGDLDKSHFVDTGVTPLTVHLAKGLEDQPFHQCFPTVPAGFDQFKVKIVVKDEAGNDLDFGQDSTLVSTAFNASSCVEQTPVPSPPASPGTGQGGGQPSVSPSVAAAVALAQTGGFDFRLPIVGLTVLVAGLGILLVSASRGRRSTSR